MGAKTIEFNGRYKGPDRGFTQDSVQRNENWPE